MSPLEFGYISFSIIISTILLLMYSSALQLFYTDHEVKRKKMLNASFALMAWFSYLFVLSNFELLVDYSLPPRFPLLVFVPLILLFVSFYIKKRNDPFVSSVPLSWVVAYQSFRVIVELLLFFTFYQQIIPVEATVEGVNFDVVMGISALLLAFWVRGIPTRTKLWVVGIWSVIGILMVLWVGFVIGSSIYFPTLWGYVVSPVEPSFVVFPYLLIPGFLAPSAIFIHIVTLIHVRKGLIRLKPV